MRICSYGVESEVLWETVQIGRVLTLNHGTRLGGRLLNYNITVWRTGGDRDAWCFWAGLETFQEETAGLAGSIYGKALQGIYRAVVIREQSLWTILETRERITDDRKKTGVIVSISRSKVIFHIANLVYDGAINMSDLEEFSDDVKTSVRMFLRMEENGHWGPVARYG